MAHGPPPLSRARLEQVLGLDPGATNAEMLRVGAGLLARIEARRSAAEGEERAALDAEIETLTSSLVHSLDMVSPDSARATSASNAALSSRFARDRLHLAAIAILAAVVMGLLAARLNDSTRAAAPSEKRVGSELARLVVESRPKTAELRVRSPETEELLLKIPGESVSIDLEPGLYQLEVSREDCPDRWTREIELEPAETRRYEPTICVGAGEVVVRSNVEGDRLRVDELDLGVTRAEPHLLGVGDHTIRVEKTGYLPFDGRVRVRPDERIELRAELVPSLDRAAAASGETARPAPPPLPFEVVAPSAAPGQAGAKSPTGPAGIGRSILPEPMRPERVEIVKPELDFEAPSLPRAMPTGGSTTWHDVITRRVLSRFDTDRSGRIDRGSETEAIPCEFWKTIEASFDDGGLGISMSRLYGFDGSEWHPMALGFDAAQRGLAYQRMQACGLKP